MDTATLGALGTILVGLAVAGASLVGHLTQSRSARDGQVVGGYSTLVDDLQEERDQLRTQLTDKTTELAAAYAELARERADTTTMHRRIAELTTECDGLRERLAELEGRPA
ncbi:hypothetical protein ACGFZH_20850 [Streptomyces zaomyceticus]|uniref:hypothetical protein n=1 Tax=Streptomyces zaomyceticus TaxID=68286 RepID=UPI003712B6B6